MLLLLLLNCATPGVTNHFSNTVYTCCCCSLLLLLFGYSGLAAAAATATAAALLLLLWKASQDPLLKITSRQGNTMPLKDELVPKPRQKTP